MSGPLPTPQELFQQVRRWCFEHELSASSVATGLGMNRSVLTRMKQGNDITASRYVALYNWLHTQRMEEGRRGLLKATGGR